MQPPVPRVGEKTGITIKNQTSWRAKKMKEYFNERYGLNLEDTYCSKVAHQELVNTLSADNIPDIASVLRRQWLKEVKNAGCKAIVQDTLFLDVMPNIDVNTFGPSDIDTMMTMLEIRAPLFGSCKEVETAKADYERAGVGGGFKRWLMAHFPRVYASLGRFHKSWHISERLDYLAGKLTFGLERLHPALTGVVASIVAGIVKPSRSKVRNSIGWVATAIEAHVWNCPISQRVYHW